MPLWLCCNTAGSGLDYATFLGGSSDDYGKAVTVDSMSRAYVLGDTSSSDFPTTPEALDPTFNGGRYDAFVTKLEMSSDQPCCDFDGDGTVDVDDIVIVADLWGQLATEPYDQDGDGVITVVDIQRVGTLVGLAHPVATSLNGRPQHRIL